MTSPDKNLSINQNVEVVVEEGPYKGNYNSKISDITDDEIMIMAIYKREEIIPLREGLEVKILYEGDNAFYALTTEIKGRVHNPIPTIILKQSDEIERIQRRSYFRLQVNKDIKYLVIKELKEEEEQPDFKQTTAIDLSGGGLLMVLQEDLNIKDRLLFDLDIDELDKLIEGKIVRIAHNENEFSKTAGVEFINVQRQDRDQIISFLFNYQRKLRRRGMI